MLPDVASPTLPAIDRVRAMEAALFAVPEHHIEIVPVHRFAHGLYVREVSLPAGCIAVGHMHAQEHVTIISKGRLQIVTEDGVEEVTAPATFIVPAGRKNCVHVLEDAVWTTIHASDARTVDEAEALLIMPEGVKCLS
jgi:quercetin dioxygenase-like cupin family protein